MSPPDDARVELVGWTLEFSPSDLGSLLRNAERMQPYHAATRTLDRVPYLPDVARTRRLSAVADAATTFAEAARIELAVQHLHGGGTRSYAVTTVLDHLREPDTFRYERIPEALAVADAELGATGQRDNTAWPVRETLAQARRAINMSPTYYRDSTVHWQLLLPRDEGVADVQIGQTGIVQITGRTGTVRDYRGLAHPWPGLDPAPDATADWIEPPTPSVPETPDPFDWVDELVGEVDTAN